MRRPRRSLDALLVITALVLVSGVGLAAPRITGSPTNSAAPSASAAAASSTPAVAPTPSTTPLVGKTYYLGPDGDDRAAGTAAKPWETLTHAAAKLKPGDILEILAGTYKRQSVDWRTSGSASGPITIRAAAGARPVFDGDGVGHFAVIRGGAGYLVFDGLTITGYDIVDDGIIVAMEGAHDLTLQNLRMTGNDGQDQRSHLIYLGAPDVHDVVIRANLLDGIKGGAIHMYHGPNAQHVQITDNVLRGSHWGVIVTSGANDVVIDHNTFIDNDVGVEMWDATGVSISNNLITSDHGTGIRLAALAPLSEDYDLLQVHGVPFVIDTDELDLAGWQAATGQAVHSTVATPGVPLIGDDLRPLPGSGAIGAASDGTDLGTRVFP